MVVNCRNGTPYLNHCVYFRDGYIRVEGLDLFVDSAFRSLSQFLFFLASFTCM